MRDTSSDLQSTQGLSSFSLLSDLRNPILEVALQAEKSDNREQYLVARNALKLIDGYLYAEELAKADQIELFPCSLTALTSDAVKAIEPLAKLYGIKLRLKKSRSTRLVSLDKQAFMHATHGLLYTIIGSLQNNPGNVDIIVEMKDKSPSIKIYSELLDINEQDIKTGSKLKSRLNTMTTGPHSGISLASTLYGMIGDGLSFTSNQYGKGLAASFKLTKQMSLTEAVA
ncbi:MAG: hypothetical protein AAF413_03115 [Patescibacteria group bacterium]